MAGDGNCREYVTAPNQLAQKLTGSTAPIPIGLAPRLHGLLKEFLHFDAAFSALGVLHDSDCLIGVIRATPIIVILHSPGLVAPRVLKTHTPRANSKIIS